MSTVPMPVTAERASAPLRDQLSNLQSLHVLSMLMTESRNESSILQLAATSVPSLGRCHTEGVYLPDGGSRPQVTPGMKAGMSVEIESQLDTLGTNGGPLAIADEVWVWAFPLRSLTGHIGFFVVGAAGEPSSEGQFLLRVLAQQTGVALANAQHRAQEQATAEELRMANA